jgi:hypothetical protein
VFRNQNKVVTLSRGANLHRGSLLFEFQNGKIVFQVQTFLRIMPKMMSLALQFAVVVPHPELEVMVAANIKTPIP